MCGTVRREERHTPRQDPATCPHRHTDHRESNAHTKKTYYVDHGTYSDSVPLEIYNVHVATRSASSYRDEELAIRVLRTRRLRSDSSTLRRNKFRACQMEIINSQQCFNFHRIALTVQPGQPLHSSRSASDLCILTITKH